MTLVEEAAIRGPVRIGIGSEDQFRALLQAGADEVCSHGWFREVAADDAGVLRVAFREEDTVLMVQPNLLSTGHILKLAKAVTSLEVPGHGAQEVTDERSAREFRKLKGRVQFEREENRGAKAKWPQPNQREIDVIVRWWRSDIKRAEVVGLVQGLLDAKVPDHWIRDQVKKATGSAARKPG